EDAHGLFSETAADAESKIVRIAAMRGYMRKFKSDPVEIIRAFLEDNGREVRAAATSALPDLSTDELCAIATDFGKLSTGSKVAILTAARIRGERKLLPIALDGSKSYTEPVRVAAIRALGTVGDISVLPQLVQEAAKDGAAAEAARESI